MKRRFLKLNQAKRLFNLAFFEIDVLADDGVIFLFDHFFSHCTGVLFGYVKIACAGCRIQTDFNGCWLRHGSRLSCSSRHIDRV